ncbi:hypothetical protein ALC53_01624 [Atta colombica]|uniref:Uncharacterized protein n=1 Tax=Atta colombica TaxID=520822 RepID=A0A195BV39_9HYME|nr:hypothetical protein ALC53_01624 [Atta colombica]
MQHRAIQKSLARHAGSRMPDLRNCESGTLCGDEARRVADDILALLLTVSPLAQQHVQPSLVAGRVKRPACPPSPRAPTHVDDNHSGTHSPTTVTHYRSALTSRYRPDIKCLNAHWRINADYLVVVHHEISNYCVVGETGDVSVASKTSMVSTCGTIYVYPGASLPSFSFFLSSSLTILKFHPHPILFFRKVASIISIIKTRCTAALCCLSLVFPDAFKPTPVVGAFSDQLPFPPLTLHLQLPLLSSEVEDRDGRNGKTFDSNVADEHGGHDESVHANSTEPVRIS